MTYNQRMIAQFVENTIENINKRVEFYSKDITRSAEARKSFALETINNEYNKAYGALLFTEIYLEGIEEADYGKLKKKLDEALSDAIQRAMEDIK